MALAGKRRGSWKTIAERTRGRGSLLEADADDGAGERPGPSLRVIDLLRQYAPAYVDRYADQAVPQVQSVLAKLALCRTAALGGHTYEFPQCQHCCQFYNPCIDRHCPQCSGGPRADWLAKTSTVAGLVAAILLGADITRWSDRGIRLFVGTTWVLFAIWFVLGLLELGLRL